MFQVFRFWVLCGLSSALIGCATPGPMKNHVVQSDDGLSEISAPESWHTRPNLARNADIRLADSVRNHYLLVTTYQPGEIEPMSLEQFADRVTGAILDNVGNGNISVPRPLTIDQRAAIEHVLNVTVGNTPLVYVSLVVDGRRARYHLVGWAPAGSSFDELQRVMSTFRESDVKRAAKSRVNLEFKWPTTMTSKASFHNKANKRGETLEIQGEVVSSVKPASKSQLLISSRVVRQKMTTGDKRNSKNIDKDAYLQEVLKAALTDIPDYVVNSDGEFVRVDNLAGYHKRVQDALIKGLPKGDPEASAKAKQLVQSLLTEESLSATMQDEWNTVVENWAGGSYAVGEKYEFTVPYQAAALNNQTFPMVMTQQLAEHVPCHSGTTTKTCVRLLQNSRVSGPEYTHAMNEFVRKTVSREVTVSSMEVVKTVELITDPKTLIPYRSNEKQIKRVTVNAAGKTDTSEEVEESSTSYSY